MQLLINAVIACPYLHNIGFFYDIFHKLLSNVDRIYGLIKMKLTIRYTIRELSANQPTISILKTIFKGIP